MEDIKLNKADFANKIKLLKDCKNDIIKYSKELNTTLNNIADAWQGSDAARYISKMRDDYLFSFGNGNEGNSSGIIDGLDKCVEYIENHVPNDYDEHDENYKGKDITV